MSKTCKNCDFSFDDSYKFCPNCGQNYHEELTVTDIFKNTVNNYFSVDARFFKSFLPLLFKPGFLPLQYAEGKRLKYLNPAQFYLFATIVFFFLFSFEVRKQEQRIDAEVEQTFKELDKEVIPKDALIVDTDSILKDKKDKNIEVQIQNGETTKLNKTTLDSLVQVGASDESVLKSLSVNPNASTFEKKFYLQLFKFYKHRNSSSIIDTFYNYVPISLFVLLPVFAFILMLMHSKKRIFARHLVFSLYYFAFLFILFSIFTIIHFVVDLSNFVIPLILVISFVYLYFAILKFYKSRKRTSFIKAVIISMVFIILIIPVTLGILVTAAVLYY